MENRATDFPLLASYTREFKSFRPKEDVKLVFTLQSGWTFEKGNIPVLNSLNLDCGHCALQPEIIKSSVTNENDKVITRKKKDVMLYYFFPKLD